MAQRVKALTSSFRAVGSIPPRALPRRVFRCMAICCLGSAFLLAPGTWQLPLGVMLAGPVLPGGTRTAPELTPLRRSVSTGFFASLRVAPNSVF